MNSGRRSADRNGGRGDTVQRYASNIPVTAGPVDTSGGQLSLGSGGKLGPTVSGSFAVTSSNTYYGPTTINGGHTLTPDNGSATGAIGRGAVDGGGILNLNRTDAGLATCPTA